ncbi:MAG: cation diffusion facilitator family transporter, partial [Candidatus Micrarchaeia archaeon]
MEAAHVISDFILTLFVLVAIKVARSNFARSFSYGLFKLEDLIALFIAIFILYIGIEFLINGFNTVPKASMLAAIFELASVIPLFVAGYAKVKAGMLMNSPSLSADGKHTYTDVYEGMGVALGLALYSVTEMPVFYLLAISLAFVVLVLTAYSIAKSSLLSLLDLPKEKGVNEKIKSIILGVDGVKNVNDLKVRWSGPVLFAEVAIEVDPFMTIDEAHPITEEIERRIRAKFESVYSVVVHVEPKGRENFKVLVPVEEEKYDSRLSMVLAKSRYFAIVEIGKGSDEKVQYIENPMRTLSEHVAIKFKNFLIEKKVTDLVCRDIGESVYGLLLAHNIYCWHSEAESLEKNIQLFKEKKLFKMQKYNIKKHK